MITEANNATMQAMQLTFSLYKKRGQTPLEAINAFKQQYKEYADATLSYAGRLDPMAEGLLLILVNDENKKRASYQNLEKTYEFSLLFGVATDTYDPLGILKTWQPHILTQPEKDTFEKLVQTYPRSFDQPYPPYSSYHVKGKPLFYYAKNNLLHTITIPTKKVTLSDFTISSYKTKHIDEIVEELLPIWKNITGDFRQKDIYDSWITYKKSFPTAAFTLVTCCVTTSSGTYIRSLAHDIGMRLGKGALAYHIIRTRIGSYTLTNAIRM